MKFNQLFKTYSFDQDRFLKWVKDTERDELYLTFSPHPYNLIQILLNKEGHNKKPSFKVNEEILKRNIPEIVEEIFLDNSFFYIYPIKRENFKRRRHFSISLNCLPDNLITNPNEKNDESLLSLHSIFKDNKVFLDIALKRFDAKRQVFENFIKNRDINYFLENYGRTNFYCIRSTR